jgi:hypothetical protein
VRAEDACSAARRSPTGSPAKLRVDATFAALTDHDCEPLVADLFGAKEGVGYKA